MLTFQQWSGNFNFVLTVPAGEQAIRARFDLTQARYTLLFSCRMCCTWNGAEMVRHAWQGESLLQAAMGSSGQSHRTSPSSLHPQTPPQMTDKVSLYNMPDSVLSKDELTLVFAVVLVVDVMAKSGNPVV